MIRGLVPPIAGYFSNLMFGTHFSYKKVFALIVTMVGVALGCFVELYYEAQEGAFQATTVGIIILISSAFTQAL